MRSALAWHISYTMPLGTHVFPADKYERTFARCRALGLLERTTLFSPAEPIDRTDLRRVHREEYLARIDELAEDDPLAGLAEFEAPCLPGVVRAQATMARGTVMLTDWVLAGGGEVRRGLNVGGGFHHAYSYRGAGFCLYNDIAISITKVLGSGLIARALVVDTDVHQGNGTCHIFRDDARVYTLDIHQANNYPPKEPASCNIGLADGCGDDDYLAALAPDLACAIELHQPDFIHYVAGGDPWMGDRLGGLALTKAGFRRRDELVIGSAERAGIPLVATLAGGYAEDTADLVDIHAALAERITA